jgi:choline kinase
MMRRRRKTTMRHRTAKLKFQEVFIEIEMANGKMVEVEAKECIKDLKAEAGAESPEERKKKV